MKKRENLFKTYKRKYYGISKTSKCNKNFQKSSIAVACSRWDEPFGRTSLEASANGCAVIITNKGGLSETVTNAKILNNLVQKNYKKILIY